MLNLEYNVNRYAKKMELGPLQNKAGPLAATHSVYSPPTDQRYASYSAG